MNTENSNDIALRAEAIYQSQLKDRLERTHPSAFVAIEPDSGDYFLGQTLSEAISSARQAHPNRLCHALRVGHKTAIHFGTSLR
jgi:hypothetical protein